MKIISLQTLNVVLIVLLLLMLAGVPSVEAAIEAEAEGWGWLEALGRWVNLLILAGVLYFLTRKPLSKFLQDRRRSIQEEIRLAAAAREDAEQKLAEIEARVKNLDRELEEIRLNAEREAEVERRRLEQQAEDESAKILAHTEREVERMTRAGLKQLQEYAAGLSVELARRQIESELKPDDEERVIQRFFVELSGREGGR